MTTVMKKLLINSKSVNEGECFSSSIHMTILNGDVVFRDGVSIEEPKGRRLEFKKL